MECQGYNVYMSMIYGILHFIFILFQHGIKKKLASANGCYSASPCLHEAIYRRNKKSQCIIHNNTTQQCNYYINKSNDSLYKKIIIK